MLDYPMEMNMKDMTKKKNNMYFHVNMEKMNVMVI